MRYTHSNPRSWTDEDVSALLKMKSDGYSCTEIADVLGRTPTSISIKMKRLGKKSERYNSLHREEKYETNQFFYNTYHPKTILDCYCGTESWWLKHADGASVLSNDMDNAVLAQTHLPADKLVALLYANDEKFDIIDLDPFGSAYDCFDLAIRMARIGLIITFGEMGHKRWKRLDFVRPRYGITKMEDFTTNRLLEGVQRMGRINKKELTPVIVKEWPRVSRVYFTISPLKITEQWEKKISL